MRSVAHIEPFSGASGDMLLGAVLDAGVPLDDITRMLAGLDVDGWTLGSEDVLRGGIRATLAHVTARDDGLVRTWGNVRELLLAADLPDPVRDRAVGAFSRLAEAEAHVHRMAVERVHFHEVGAIDAIVDVVGVSAGLYLLGVDTVSCGPVALGSGMTRSAHGLLPVPGPAVLELLRGAPTLATDASVELCTPTGAALLAEWTEWWGPQPSMAVERIGYGAGIRQLDRPNAIRLVVGRPVAATATAGTALVLEATIDDLTGELVPPLLDALRDAGATDAWATPVLGKKGRPALVISCIGDPALGDTLRGVLFRESSTLGVRGRVMDKWSLDRDWVTVWVEGAAVRLKIGRLAGEVVNVAPEYDDCVVAARSTGLALKEVFARARAAWDG